VCSGCFPADVDQWEARYARYSSSNVISSSVQARRYEGTWYCSRTSSSVRPLRNVLRCRTVDRGDVGLGALEGSSLRLEERVEEEWDEGWREMVAGGGSEVNETRGGASGSDPEA